VPLVCLILGLWIERLGHLWPDALADTPIIHSSTGDPWTSFYFHKHHLYVWLHKIRAEGDPFLRAVTEMTGNRIEDKYYSWERTIGADTVPIPNAPMVL
jgi:hypothetical protein